MDMVGALNRLGYAVDVFRERYPDIPASTIRVFCLVAASPGASGMEMARRLGMTQAAVSRHLSILGEVTWKGVEGLRLVSTREQLHDRRAKGSYLTPAGVRLAERLVELIGGHGSASAGASDEMYRIDMPWESLLDGASRAEEERLPGAPTEGSAGRGARTSVSDPKRSGPQSKWGR